MFAGEKVLKAMLRNNKRTKQINTMLKDILSDSYVEH